MATFSTTYEDESEREWDLEVEFSYYAGCKGRTEGGVPMDPDDEEELEIYSIRRFETTSYMRWEWVDFDPEDHPDCKIDFDQEARDYMSEHDGP